MEPRSGDAGGSCGPTLTSSWEAARGLLTRSLHVTRNGLGAHDPDWEELLAPPAAGCAGTRRRCRPGDGRRDGGRTRRAGRGRGTRAVPGQARLQSPRDSSEGAETPAPPEASAGPSGAPSAWAPAPWSSLRRRCPVGRPAVPGAVGGGAGREERPVPEASAPWGRSAPRGAGKVRGRRNREPGSCARESAPSDVRIHVSLSRELVSLKSSRSPPDEKPCFLHLRCAPNGGEEILSIGILSSARNMEVYLEEEYGGTSRGKSVCTVLDDSEHGKILLYKNHIKLESSTHACKIKLLSFGEKQCVFISKVVAHVRPSSAHSSPSCPMLGSRLDLDNIQSIMESMGSKLSPGAQQLMDMIRCQQKSCIPIREQLQSVLGTTRYKHMVALQSPSAPGALDKSSSTPFPFRSVLTSSSATENSKPFTEESTQPPGGNGHTANQSQRTIVPPNHSLLENDLKNAVSFFPKKASDTPEVPHSELLPFLQNLCSQVNHLRIGHNAKWQENISKPQEGIVSVAMEEQPIYSYLEKILSKNMELMEKKLMDYIDQRVCKLQEHMDAKIDLLMGMLQNPSSPPPGMPLIHYDSREKLSNGER